MNWKVIQADFYVGDKNDDRLCRVEISEPKLSEEGDASCEVLLQPILKREKEIFGADETQARELALAFVRNFLLGKDLFDSSGAALELADDSLTSLFK